MAEMDELIAKLEKATQDAEKIMGEYVELVRVLRLARAALSYVEQVAPGYDWNADPLNLTLTTGKVYAATDAILERVAS